jgi:hypothetical protein
VNAPREQTVVGDTPNLAARLRALAGPGAVLTSAATNDLVGDCLGGARRARLADFPLVGRDEEVGLLRRAWQQSKEERYGQVVFVGGEPGIGKWALVDPLRRAARAEGLTRITFRCSPYHTNSALYPVIEHWRRLSGWRPADDGAARLAKLESALAPYRLPREEVVPLLLSLPPNDGYRRLDLTRRQLKEQTGDALVALTREERQLLLEVLGRRALGRPIDIGPPRPGDRSGR